MGFGWVGCVGTTHLEFEDARLGVFGVPVIHKLEAGEVR